MVRMKMSEGLYRMIRSEIRSVLDRSGRDQVVENYRRGDFHRADMVKDINMRLRWDLFWAAFYQNRDIRDTLLLEDLTSDHIDTALRRIQKELGFIIDKEGA